MHFLGQPVLSLSATFCDFSKFFFLSFCGFPHFQATFSEILHKFPATFSEILHEKADTKRVGFTQILRNKMGKFLRIYRNNSPSFIGMIPTIFIDYFLGNTHYFILHFSALLFAHFPADRHGSLRYFPPRFDIKCHSNSGGMPRFGMPKSKTTPKNKYPRYVFGVPPVCFIPLLFDLFLPNL